MTTSSITAALPGTASSTSRGQSCPSACAIGHIGPDQRDLVLRGPFSPGLSSLSSYRHVVAIHKDWHESLLLPFACAAQDVWSDVLVRCSQPAIGEHKHPSRREGRGGCLSAAARPSESSITRRRASV